MSVIVLRLMIDSPTYRMADRLARGHLADRILSLRSEGLSWAAITSRLYADHGIEISAVTAADWHDQLAEEKAA